jgi:hypothetical protein
MSVHDSLRARIMLPRNMTLDNILYDMGRIALRAHNPIPFKGLEIWVLEVRATLTRGIAGSDQTLE